MYRVIIILTILLSGCTSLKEGAGSEERNDEQVVYDAYDLALNRFEAGHYPLLFGSYKDYPRRIPEDLEFFVLFDWDDTDLTAELRIAKDLPVWSQLWNIWELNSGLSDAELAARVEMERHIISEAECPALRNAWEQLNQTIAAAGLPEEKEGMEELVIVLHPRLYVLAASTMHLDLRVEVNGTNDMSEVIDESVNQVRACYFQNDT